jgi:hypothetical protein
MGDHQKLALKECFVARILDLEPALFDYDQLRAYLGNISRSKAKEIVASEDIVKVNIGTRALFLRSSVDAYIERSIDARGGKGAAATGNGVPLDLANGESAERTKKHRPVSLPAKVRRPRRSQGPL